MTWEMLGNIGRAPQIMFAKWSVLRRELPFELNLDGYSESDYEKIIPSLREVESRLTTVRPDRQGLRWIHLREAVLFYGERIFDLVYDDFVARVNISHVGEFYRDSLSTATRVVDCDRFGRSVRQGVRVVALPQPNYASFMGKGNLDVYKLEKIDYGDRNQRIWMLTVHSPNGSAVCDDGYVSFSSSPDGRQTVVAFLACQNFPIPPLMAFARLDRWNWLKRVLTESAYRRFFRAMMSNILYRYHGRDFRVGRACRGSSLSTSPSTSRDGHSIDV